LSAKTLPVLTADNSFQPGSARSGVDSFTGAGHIEPTGDEQDHVRFGIDDASQSTLNDGLTAAT